MIKEELNQIGKYAKREELNVEEVEQLKLLLLKWMYEQRMLD